MLKSSNSDNFTEVGVSAILFSDFFISVAKPPLSIKNMFFSKTSAKLEDASVKLLQKNQIQILCHQVILTTTCFQARKHTEVCSYANITNAVKSLYH